MMLPAPKKNANSIKPTATISVSFNVCFTDNPFLYLMNVVYASTTFLYTQKLMSICGSIYKIFAA